MADFERLQAAVEAGDREAAVEITQAAIDEGIAPLDILDPMTEAMGVIGERFSRQQIFVPEMLISARAMKGAVALLEPLLIGSGHKPDKVAVLGTIKGDLHDIGKNLVAMMLKGANFQIVDLGTNTTAEEFLEAAREHKADVNGCSALLTTTMGNMRDVIAAVAARRPAVIIGAPRSRSSSRSRSALTLGSDALRGARGHGRGEKARGQREIDGVVHPEVLAAAAA